MLCFRLQAAILVVGRKTPNTKGVSMFTSYDTLTQAKFYIHISELQMAQRQNETVALFYASVQSDGSLLLNHCIGNVSISEIPTDVTHSPLYSIQIHDGEGQCFFNEQVRNSFDDHIVLIGVVEHDLAHLITI